MSASRRSEMETLAPDPVIEAYKQHVDRTLLRENHKLSVEERICKLMELRRFAEECAVPAVRPRNTHDGVRETATLACTGGVEIHPRRGRELGRCVAMAPRRHLRRGAGADGPR